MREVIRIILGNAQFHSGQDVISGNLAPFTTDDLVDAKSDLYRWRSSGKYRQADSGSVRT